MSSVSITPMSRTGSTLPMLWTMSSLSKQRTTWMIASHSRMFERKSLPSPSPLEAPAYEARDVDDARSRPG
jgi:hypothetical protein